MARKLKEQVQEVVRQRNAHGAGVIADYLRFAKGMNYDDIYRFVNDCEPISPQAWESLLYESETT